MALVVVRNNFCRNVVNRRNRDDRGFQNGGITFIMGLDEAFSVMLRGSFTHLATALLSDMISFATLTGVWAIHAQSTMCNAQCAIYNNINQFFTMSDFLY